MAEDEIQSAEEQLGSGGDTSTGEKKDQITNYFSQRSFKGFKTIFFTIC